MPAQTSIPAFADPAAPPFLARIQRIHSDKNVCAIVRGDGLFHVEVETSRSIEISQGTLGDDELADFKTVLSNQDLVALNQQKIVMPLVITEKDEFVISILRSPLTQNLSFIDRESRRPFDNLIDPLLHWVDTLQHHSRTRLSEVEGRNNCMPPKKLEFSARRAPPPEALSGSEMKGARTAPSASTPTSVERNAFLMRWDVNHIAGGSVDDTCVIVYPSGRYRVEKSTQGYQSKLKFRAFENALDSADMEQLEDLLNQPELKSSTHRNLAGGKVFREGELATLDVSREGHVQQLSFASYFGVPGWVSNISAGTDPEDRLVAPLRKWLKAHVEGKKIPALEEATVTHCVPRPEEVHP